MKSAAREFFVFLFLVLLSGVDSGAAPYRGAGTTNFDLLALSCDVRSHGMGGVSVGVANGVYGISGNPAAMGFLDRMQAMISYVPIILDVRAGGMAFARPFENSGVWSGGLSYISYGTYDNLLGRFKEPIEGTLHPYALLGSVSWSRLLRIPLSFGVSVKGVYQRLSDGLGDDVPAASADGFASDIGVQYRATRHRVVYGLLLRNLGFVRSGYSGDSRGRLPFSLATGFCYVLKYLPDGTLAIDLEKPVDDYLTYRAGLEIGFYKGSFLVRVGYQFSQEDLEHAFGELAGHDEEDYQKSNWNLLALGAGVATEIGESLLKIDFAFQLRVDRLPPTFSVSGIVGF